MISPNTPPGTPLVVVWLPQTAQEANAEAHPLFCALDFDASKQKLRLGNRCVLDRIVPHFVARCGYVAIIQGLDGVYFLRAFDIATLPESLTSLLAGKPVTEEVE